MALGQMKQEKEYDVEPTIYDEIYEALTKRKEDLKTLTDDDFIKAEENTLIDEVLINIRNLVKVQAQVYYGQRDEDFRVKYRIGDPDPYTEHLKKVKKAEKAAKAMKNG